MIAFIIKSTICLALLYGLYFILLRNCKTFVFNRFYLLYALIFSITIPFIKIRVNLNLPINTNLPDISTASFIFNSGENITDDQRSLFTFQNTALALYLIISLILFIRFTFNFIRIIRLIRKNFVVNALDLKIVAVDNQTLPYSFFQYIFLNRHQFQNGLIEKELLLHEQVHCKQLHSADILFTEIVSVVLWFNPFLWFFKKAIQLNHEYIADQSVLNQRELNDYLNVLTSLVFRNNAIYLASNLNYSLTKKRICMMTTNNFPGKTALRKIAALSLFLILAITITSSQKSNITMNMNFDNEWWSPILKRHHIQPTAFNNFEKVFEMGSKNSIENKMVFLENAFFLIRTGKDEYIIIKSPKASHDLDKNIIETEEGTFERYRLSSKEIKPIESFSFKDLKYSINVPDLESGLNDHKSQELSKKDMELAAKEQALLSMRQLKLEEEQKAAAIDQQLSQEEQNKLTREKLSLKEEQKAALIDQQAFKEGKIKTK